MTEPHKLITKETASASAWKRAFEVATQHSARLGLFVLATGAVASLGLEGQLSPLLLSLFGGLGVEAFGILLDRASQKGISNEDLFVEIQHQFTLHQFESLLTQPTFQKELSEAFVQQAQTLTLLLGQSQEETCEPILAELARLEGNLDSRFRDGIRLLLLEVREKYGGLREGQKSLETDLLRVETRVVQGTQLILSLVREKYGELREGQKDLAFLSTQQYHSLLEKLQAIQRAQPVPPTSRLHNVPPLPDHYLPRPSYLPVVQKFSYFLNEITMAQTLSGVELGFISKVKAKPPFLGLIHLLPVILPEHERIITEYFLANEFIKVNKHLILTGGRHTVKSGETLEKIAENHYKDKKFSGNIEARNGINDSRLTPGMVIYLPYIDTEKTRNLSSEYIEHKYSFAEWKKISVVLALITRQHNLIESETFKLINWIYQAAKNVL